MVTASELKKSVDLEYAKLTPAELARVITAAERQLCMDESEGKITGTEITKREDEIEAIFTKHVLPRSFPEYAKFWKEMYTEERRIWGREYFTAILHGLAREDAAITLLIIRITRTIHQQDPEHAERDRVFIEGFKARLKSIRGEVDKILSASFWETLNLEKPTIELTDDALFGLLPDLVDDTGV